MITVFDVAVASFYSCRPYNLKQKTDSYFFFIYFSKYEAVRFSRLWRLIERVVDSDFMMIRKMKHQFVSHQIKTGVPFSPNLQTLLRKNVPQSIIASRKLMFRVSGKTKSKTKQDQKQNKIKNKTKSKTKQDQKQNKIKNKIKSKTKQDQKQNKIKNKIRSKTNLDHDKHRIILVFHHDLKK